MNRPFYRNKVARYCDRARRRRLFIEPLEDRRLLATFVVNSIADLPDSGEVPGTCDTELDPTADPPIAASDICTFRAAIESANANGGRDTITFDLPEGAVISTDGVSSSGDVDIIGPAGRIIINGPGKDTASGGIVIGGNGNSVIRNLVLNNFTEAIWLVSDNNTVANVYVGVNVDGNAAIGNTRGIVVEGLNNVVGGATETDRNVISGNEVGIFVVKRLGSSAPVVRDNRIIGNYIGTDKNGTASIGNTESGITISQLSQNNVIGGAEGAGNLISGNGRGITIEHQTARHNHVIGNLIGTAIDGETALGNLEGVFINDAQFNCIGGIVPPATGSVPNCSSGPIGAQPFLGNVISGSRGDFPNAIFGMGVWIVNVNATGNLIQGNKIGTDISGTIAVQNAGDGVNINSSSGNTIGGTPAARRNIISGNAGDGVTIFGNTALPSASGNVVAGNYIGVDVTGAIDLGNGFRGVHIDSNATNNVIGGDLASDRNIISGNDADGVIIALQQATGNVVKGNYIGTDKDGILPVGNTESGIFLFEAPDNIIGQTGGTSFSRNVISGNYDGVKIQGADATENIIEGNLIGTDVTGSARIKNNNHGIYILDSSENRIGTQTTLSPDHPNFPGNVISGNDDDGIRIEGMTSAMNYIGGNLIGTKSNGQEGLANTLHGINVLNAPKTRIGVSLTGEPALSGNTLARNFDGIRLDGAEVKETLIGGNFIGTAWQATVPIAPNFEAVPVEQSVLLGNTRGINIRDGSNNFVGGFVPDNLGGGTQLPANIIAGNGTTGVRIQGDSATGNRIQRNSIFSNGALGIDLGGDGVTPNDAVDDRGPNLFQNFPIVDGIDAGGTLTGTLHSNADSTFTIDVYLSPEVDPSSNVEGTVWIGEKEVVTDGDGDATFDIDLDLEKFSHQRTITVTATDGMGNTSEFSAPLLLADLQTELDALSIGQIERRGAMFVLPYSSKVTNTGTAPAEDAVIRIMGNGQVLDVRTVSLDACMPESGSCPFEEVVGEWDITSLFGQGELGAPVTLELDVEADPEDTIAEFPQPVGMNNNLATGTIEDVDPRPRIKLIESEYQPGHTFLPGVSLPNRFDISVDWNGNLDDSQIGADQQAVINAFVNGVIVRTKSVSDPLQDTSLAIDFGSELTTGTNIIHFRADTDLHTFFSDYAQLDFEQSFGINWIDTALVTVSGVPASSPHNKTAVYKAGVGFPRVSTEGFFGIPVDRVGMIGGKFGPRIPQITVRVEVRSDRTGTIEGEAKFEGEVAGKKVGADDFGEIGGKAIGKLTGDVIFDGFFPTLLNASTSFRLEGFVTTPAIPLPPPASFIQAQVKLNLAVDATADIVHRDGDDHLAFGGDVVLGLEPTLEGILSIGRDGLATVEVGIGGTLRGEYDLDEDPCFNRSATAELFARLKATFLVFEAQKTFRFPFAATGCGVGGEGESLFASPLVSSDLQLLPRYIVNGSEEGEAATTGLPTIAYPYARPAIARHADGTMTLVYIDEDATKQDAQHLEVFAARFDGVQWSAPVQVSDDTLIDDAPTVTYDASGRAIALWTRLKTPITDVASADPAALLADLEIVYAVHDPDTDTWSAPTALTDNAHLDFLPQLNTDEFGNTTVAWLRDLANDSPIFPDDAALLGADVMFSEWNGTEWSTPIVAVSDAHTNATPQFDVRGNEGVLVLSDDSDAELTTIGDRAIHISLFDGSSWSTPTVMAGTADGLADLSPRVAYDSTGRAVVAWVKRGVSIGEEESDVTDQLFYSDVTAGTPTAPAAAIHAPSINDLQLLIDSDDNPLVIWQALSNAGPDIFYSRLDRSSGEWGEPRQFTDDADLEWWFSPFINGDGQLEILHLSREVGTETAPTGDGSGAEGEPGDTILIPTLGNSSLQTQATSIGQDLNIVSLTLSEANPIPGSTVQVTATVLNGGDLGTPASEIGLSDDGVAVGVKLPVPALRAGGSSQIVFDWNVPLDAAAPHVLVAQVDPDSLLDEIDESNNVASLVALKPDLVVGSVQSSLDNDVITVTAELLNQGGSPTVGEFEVTLRQDDPDTGDVIETRMLNDQLSRGESVVVTFTITDALATLGVPQIGFVVVDSSESIEEVDETNNSNFGALDPQKSILVLGESATVALRVRKDADDVVITLQDASEILREQLVSLPRLTLPATSKNDEITIDFSRGNPVPSRGIAFSGADGDDTLILENGGTANITFHGGSGQNSIQLLGSGIQLDLSIPDESQLSNVYMLDIVGDGDNSVALNVQKVRDISPATDELMLLADVGDTVVIGTGWVLSGTEIAGGHFFRVLEQQGVTLHLSGPAQWNNPLDHLDVNNDGKRSPLDALLVINNLILPQSPFRDASNRAIDPFVLNSDGNPENDFDNFYRDTTGDGFFSPLDALLIINFLNAQFAVPEGEEMGIFAPISSNVAPHFEPTATQSPPLVANDLFTSVDDAWRLAATGPALSTRVAKQNDQAIIDLLDADELLALFHNDDLI
ncbi:MAG: hypothetical protein H6822_12080 [Planctomycetaceae bacterium]|nr:hypothetical protein [Planctomycetales bacterium]MCB9922915.1 hypothetical protein [Planctomycetaceae bacterium]